MPSPVGHLLGGAAVYLAGARKEDCSRAILGVAVLGSLLPDFDFLPGYFIGKLSAYHHGISHSLTFAGMFGVVVFFCLRWSQSDIAKRAAVAGGLSYASHIILDYLGANEGTRGVPLFWPFSNELFGLNLGLLGYFYYTNTIWSVIRWDNVPTVLRELGVIGIPVLCLFWRRTRRLSKRLSHGVHHASANQIIETWNE